MSDTKTNIIKIKTCVPNIKVANCDYNANEIIKKMEEDVVDIVLFPELCITGYTCGDLFLQSYLLDDAINALSKIVKATRNIRGIRETIFVVGVPIKVDNQLFNCMAYLQNGEIIALVPKTYIPNYAEFQEKRWFSSALDAKSNTVEIDVPGDIYYYNKTTYVVPFGTDIIVSTPNKLIKIGTDVCEDLWVPVPPSSIAAINGANIILNASASNEIVGKKEYRKDLVKMQSAKTISAYAYVSSGMSESTTDLLFSGHSIICSNGSILNENFLSESSSIAYIDIEKIENDRVKMKTFMDSRDKNTFRYIYTRSNTKGCSFEALKNDNLFKVSPHPFVPSVASDRVTRCEEILSIQSLGLVKRLQSTGIKKVVLGISGGLDSTLAFLVCCKAIEYLGYDKKSIIGITMPAFGTSDRTLNNSINLLNEFGTTCSIIDIKKSCLQHMNDIGQDPNNFDVVFENVQARERTQVLMDVANKENAIVIGTGDLSELALGWCTYNGDHMSMYSVNASIPKTLVRYLIESFAENYIGTKIYDILHDICGTPISPELLPLDNNGEIAQKTESVIGKYDIHDFLLYNMVRNGFSPSKSFELAKIAFSETDEKTIVKTAKVFYKRFFTQQFKRNCVPDGIKVGSVSLSPRGDWRMPSDADIPELKDIYNHLTKQ